MGGSSSNVLGKINSLIVQPSIRLVFAAGFLVFLWGLVQFLLASREGKIDNEGKQHMLWGVIGMFIMVAVGGILTMITSTFGIDSTGNSIPTSGNLNAPQTTFQLNQ